MADEKDKFEAPKVLGSLAELLVDGEALDLDLTQDAWEFGAPPPRGVYEVKLFIGKDGWKSGTIDPKDPKSVYVQCDLEGKITDREYEGQVVFTRVNTRVFRGKNISTMAGLLVKMGHGPALEKARGKLTPKNLSILLDKAIKQEKPIKCELDWQGQYKWMDDKGKEVYESVHRHYDDFPNLEDGSGKKHIYTIQTKNHGSQEIRARLQVNRFFGKGDELPKFSGGDKLISGPKSALTPAKALEPEIVFVSPVTVAPTGQTTTQTANVEEDLDLMLE